MSSGMFSEANVWDLEMKELQVELRFTDKDELVIAVKAYSIKNHQKYIVRETSKTKLTLVCKLHETGCPWRLRGCIKKGRNIWQITKYAGDHTCVFPMMEQDHCHLDAKFICDHVKGLVKADPTIKVGVLIERMRDEFKYTVSYKKAWHSKQKAICEIFGDWDDSYTQLPYLMKALQFYNPGTVVKIEGITQADGSQQFDRMFWSFKASIDGFVYCRPVVSIDGTHLYGKYTGKLLIAMASDANN